MQLTPPVLVTRVVVQFSHLTVFPIPSGLSYLKKNEIRYLPSGKQERLDKARNKQSSNPVTCRTNTHNIDTYIDIDNILDNAMMNQGDETISDNKIKADTKESTNDLLAYVAGQQTSSGDIRHVLAAKRAPGEQKKRQVKESASAPPTITMNGDTYYLHKGEIIHYQGHQYFSHMTECYYCMGQHTISDMDYALVNRGANSGICGTDMLVLEGSERFVDVYT
jgi:hypothetical protein